MTEEHRHSKWQAAFPTVAIVSSLILALCGGAVWVLRASAPVAPAVSVEAQLQAIGAALTLYATDHGRRLPHDATHLIGRYAPASVFYDPPKPAPATPASSTPSARGPTHRVGDVIFIYESSVDAAKLSNHVLAVSAADVDPGWRHFVMLSGTVVRVSSNSFEPRVLVHYNAGRRALGLPEISIRDIEASDKRPSAP